MLNIKQFLNQTFKSLALASLLVALMGAFLATPAVVSANDETFVNGMRPEQCGFVAVSAFDQQTGQAVSGASVWAVHETGYIAKLSETDAVGTYSGELRPGIWKIYIEAQNYERFESSLSVEPAEKEQVKAPLAANSRDSVRSGIGLASAK